MKRRGRVKVKVPAAKRTYFEEALKVALFDAAERIMENNPQLRAEVRNRLRLATHQIVHNLLDEGVACEFSREADGTLVIRVPTAQAHRLGAVKQGKPPLGLG